MIQFFRDERVLMFMLLFGYLFRESFVNFEDEIIQPFLFNPQPINRQSMVMMAGEYAIFSILSWVIYCRPKITLFYYQVALLLSCAEFLEFWATYNSRWFDIALPINITLFRFIILPLIIIYYLFKWRTLQYRDGQSGF